MTTLTPSRELTWPVVAIGVGGLVAVAAVGKIFYDQVPAYREYVEAERELQWTVAKYYGFPMLALTLVGTAGLAYMIATAKPRTVKYTPSKSMNESPSV